MQGFLVKWEQAAGGIEASIYTLIPWVVGLTQKDLIWILLGFRAQLHQAFSVNFTIL